MGRIGRILGSVALLAAAVVAPQAHASTIFTTFGPGDSYNNQSSWIIGLESPPTPFFQVGISFVAGSDGTLTSIRVPTLHIGGSANDYTVFFTEDNAGEPGSALESFAGLVFPTGSPDILTLNSVSNPALSLGSTYWVVMFAPDPANTNGGWYVNDQGFTGLFRNTGDGWFADENATPAVEVNADTTTVPEPGTLGLALAGGVLVLVLRRRP